MIPSSLLLLLCLIVALASSNKLVPSPDHCLNDGYFCFEVKLPTGEGPKYSYQVWPDDPDLLFSIYAVRTSRRSDYCTHAWNMSLDHTIDQAKVYLQFQQQNEPYPAISIEVKKMIGIPVIFNFYRWQNDNWFELAKQEMWNRFHQLDMDNHSFKYETTELLDQELGLEAKNLTIHFTMYVEKVNGTVFKKKIDFATTDGARRIFGDKSALRAKYEMEEPRRPAPATVKHEDAQEAKAETKEGATGSSATNIIIIASSIVVALLLLAAIAFAVYRS